MGGYGSGRPATRPGAEALRRFPVSYAAEALRQLRAAPVEPGKVAQASGVASWTSRGEPSGSMGYTVAEGSRGALLVLRYDLNGEPVADSVELVERPSNLGRGVVLYFRCPAPGCRHLARVLYLAAWGRFRCRRCVRPVYQSSRDSDRRVSDVLGGVRFPEVAPLSMAEVQSGDAAALAKLASRDLITLLKAAERITSTHGSAGRPWSAARRAAHDRRG